MRPLRAGLVALVLTLAVSGSAVAVAPELVSITPASSDYRMGSSNFPGPTVTLSGPAESDTTIMVTSDAPTVVTVQNVVVPNGQTSAHVLLSCVSEGSSTLHASLGGGPDLMADVRCIAAGSPWMMIFPDQARVATGHEFTVGGQVNGQAGGTQNPKYKLTVTGANPYTETIQTVGTDAPASFQYTGTTAGTDMAQICLLDNADACTTYATIAVTWIDPEASLSTNALAFGDQTVGTQSVAKAVTVTNTGAIQTTFGQATITGGAPSDYAISSDTCSNQVLAPDGQCSVSVRVTPASAGAREAVLNVVSDVPAGTPSTVALQTNGVTPSPPDTGGGNGGGGNGGGGNGGGGNGGGGDTTPPSSPPTPLVSGLKVTSKRDKRSGGLVLTIVNAGPGTVTARWTKGGGASVGKPNNGKLRLVLKPTKKDKAALKKRKQVLVKVTVTFVPAAGGTPQRVTFNSKFVRAKR